MVHMSVISWISHNNLITGALTHILTYFQVTSVSGSLSCQMWHSFAAENKWTHCKEPLFWKYCTQGSVTGNINMERGKDTVRQSEMLSLSMKYLIASKQDYVTVFWQIAVWTYLGCRRCLYHTIFMSSDICSSAEQFHARKWANICKAKLILLVSQSYDLYLHCKNAFIWFNHQFIFTLKILFDLNLKDMHL